VGDGVQPAGKGAVVGDAVIVLLRVVAVVLLVGRDVVMLLVACDMVVLWVVVLVDRGVVEVGFTVVVGRTVVVVGFWVVDVDFFVVVVVDFFVVVVDFLVVVDVAFFVVVEVVFFVVVVIFLVVVVAFFVVVVVFFVVCRATKNRDIRPPRNQSNTTSPTSDSESLCPLLEAGAAVTEFDCVIVLEALVEDELLVVVALLRHQLQFGHQL